MGTFRRTAVRGAGMDMTLLSKTYAVRRLREDDIPVVLQLCNGNPQYYAHCPPAVSAEGIRADMRALPKGAGPQNKYYLGFWQGDGLAAVMDLILEYPNSDTAFIGFFMTDAGIQGRGIGSKIIAEALGCLRERFSLVRLGCVKGNAQSERFWRKNGFSPVKTAAQADGREIIVMQKALA